MAIFDAMFEFSDGQSLTASAAATNVIDMQAADLEMGAGTPIWLNVKVGTELDSAGEAATLTIALVGDTDATIDGSSIVVQQSKQYAESECTAGAWLLRVPLDVDFDTNRYVGIYYTVGTENFTSGTIDAWLDHGERHCYWTEADEAE